MKTRMVGEGRFRSADDVVRDAHNVHRDRAAASILRAFGAETHEGAGDTALADAIVNGRREYVRVSALGSGAAAPPHRVMYHAPYAADAVHVRLVEWILSNVKC